MACDARRLGPGGMNGQAGAGRLSSAARNAAIVAAPGFRWLLTARPRCRRGGRVPRRLCRLFKFDGARHGFSLTG